MFTGIIEKKAKILSIRDGKFTVENHFGLSLKLGQSISHDGACMTVESFTQKEYTFFTMEESFKKTNFGEKDIGDYFNVERCLLMNDRIDGHFVSGHIDTIGKIISKNTLSDGSCILGISFNSVYNVNIIEKGSIAINGVSLTIVNKNDGKLTVSLIPLSQDMTNLGEIEVGDGVNLEFDMLGKYIINTTK